MQSHQEQKQYERKKTIRRSVGFGLCRTHVDEKTGRATQQIYLVKRRVSIQFNEFSRGKFSHHSNDQIRALFNGMTVQEKNIILTFDFSQIWRHVWLHDLDEMGISDLGDSKSTRSFAKMYESHERSFHKLTAGAGRQRIMALIEESTTAGDTCWGLPKGHVNADETDADAAIRELEEEAGVSRDKIMVHSARPLLSYQYPGYQNTIYQRDFFVGYTTAHVADGVSFRNKAQIKEIADAKWFSLSDLDGIICEYSNLKEIVKRCLGISKKMAMRTQRTPGSASRASAPSSPQIRVVSPTLSLRMLDKENIPQGEDAVFFLGRLPAGSSKTM